MVLPEENLHVQVTGPGQVGQGRAKQVGAPPRAPHDRHVC